MPQSSHLIPDLLSAEQVALELGISKRTLHRWGRLRKGPPRIKVGRSVFYRIEAVADWMMALEECNIVAPKRGRM
jgi:predicted DNA-binding transcriptional regulator AlpA